MDKSPIDRIRRSLGGATALEGALDAMARERSEQILARVTDLTELVVLTVVKLEEVVISYVEDRYDDCANAVEELDRLESEADDRKQEIADQLSRGGVYFLGRGDLARLASSLDIVANYAVGAADRIALRRFTLPGELNQLLVELARTDVEAVRQLQTAILAMGHDLREAIEAAALVDPIESKADALFARIYRFMFDMDTDFKTFHQLKSIIDRLESIADGCAENAELVRHMALEYLE
jgi:predicted phosphate transport protein (TIGR00153 family)